MSASYLRTLVASLSIAVVADVVHPFGLLLVNTVLVHLALLVNWWNVTIRSLWAYAIVSASTS